MCYNKTIPQEWEEETIMSYTWENPAARDAAEQSKLFWKEPKIFSEMHEGKVLYGFENMYGKVVPATFERIGVFVAGYASAYKDGEWFTIDDNGNRRKASH